MVDQGCYNVFLRTAGDRPVATYRTGDSFGAPPPWPVPLPRRRPATPPPLRLAPAALQLTCRSTRPGELALLYNSPRAATVLCEENGVLWALERKAFRYAMKQMGEEKGVTAAGFLKTVPLLAPLTDSQRSAVAHLMDELSYKDGEYVVEKVGCRPLTHPLQPPC